MININKKIASQFVAFSRTFRSDQQGFFSVLANLFAKNKDYNSNIVSPQAFGIDDWFDKDNNQLFLDGTLRLLTQLDIDQNTQWVGKYIAGINCRDDVCGQEAIFVAYANKGTKARGTIASVDTTQLVALGKMVITLNIDQNIDPTYGLVRTLSISPNGLFNEGMRNAAFYTVNGDTAFVRHIIDSNTSNTITISEGGDFGSGTNYYVPNPGDAFEIVQFNGDLYKNKNLAVDALGFYYQFTRPLVTAFTAGLKISGFGQFSTTFQQNTPDYPIFAWNGVEFSKIEDLALIHNTYSKVALVDQDYTGPSSGSNTSAVTSNQSNKFNNILFGTNPAGTWTNRLGSSGAPLTVTAAGSSGGFGYVEILAPRNIKLNEFENCWVVIASSSDPKRVGFAWLVSFHPAVTTGNTIRFTYWFDYASSNIPVAGDTIFLEIATHAFIEWGRGRVYARGSSGPQGSENVVNDFYAGGASTAAFISRTGNALQQTYKHGNISGCNNVGIMHIWGNAVILGVGFQNSTDSRRNQFNHFKSDPLHYGVDTLLVNAAAESSTLRGMRCESMRAVSNLSQQYCSITDLGLFGKVFDGEWSTGKTVNALGTLNAPTMIEGNFNAGNRDGGIWVCASIDTGATASCSTGAVAGNEPIWKNVGGGYGKSRFVDQINGLGNTIRWYELDSLLPYLHNGIGLGFNAVEGSFITMRDIRLSFGKIAISGNRIGRKIEVNRIDWYSFNNSGGPDTPIIHSFNDWETEPVVVKNPYPANGIAFMGWDFNPGVSGGGFYPFNWYPNSSRFSIAPRFHVMGSSGTDKYAWQAGWGPGDYDDIVMSLYGKKGIDQYISPIYIAPPTSHIVKDINGNIYVDWRNTLGTNDQGTAGLTNIAGRKGWYCGGKGRGNINGGEIGFAVSPAGISGTQANPFVEVGRFDLDNTSGNTRFWLYDATTGTLKRIQVGATNSGGAGFRQLIVIN